MTGQQIADTLARYRKFVVAALGFVAQGAVALTAALDSGLIPAAYRSWVVLAIALATAYGVRRAPNDPAPTEPVTEPGDGV